MRFVTQRVRFLPINVHSDRENVKASRHGSLFPDSIRCVICGPSSCGKTNLLMSLLLSPSGLKFKNIYLFGKTLHQPKYQYLRRVLNHVPEIKFNVFNDSTDLPQNAEPNTVCIFDDVTMEDQRNIGLYYSYGRHQHLDCFYLAQNYTRINKHLIRTNLNFLILFEQDELTLKHVYDDHISSADLDFHEFKKMCKLCWKEPYGYLVVDKTSTDGRYRKGLDVFIKI